MAEKQEKLSEVQVDAVMQFANALYSIDNYGYYTPWMSNGLLQNLNNSAKTATVDAIKKALEDYRDSADNLQDYSEFMQKWSEIYGRVVNYYSNMLAFDLEVIPKNVYTADEYKSDEYLADKKKVYDFLTAFDYKAEFTKAVREMLRHETYYTWFRKTKWGNKGMKFALQVMPQKRCLLSGYWEKGLLYSFDMNYFLQPGVDIEGFDPAFLKYYNNTFGANAGKQYYRPSSPLAQQDGTFAMWTQTSPEDGSWAFKMDLSNFNQTPMLAPLMKSAMINEDMAELQYNKDIQAAYAILVGDIRLFDTAKSGTKSDQFAINPKTLGGFMQKVKNGMPKKMLAVAMPTENTKMWQYEDKSPDAYKTNLKITSGLGASASRLIYSDDRMSNAEMENAILTDYNIMKPLYNQFQNFLEFFVNKLTKKYKFSFVFDGSNYEFERAKRIERALKFADKGIVLNSSYYASVLGKKPQDFERSLMEGHNDPNFLDNLSMLLNANTMKDGGSGGRPEKDATDLTDSGSDSQMYN